MTNIGRWQVTAPFLGLFVSILFAGCGYSAESRDEAPSFNLDLQGGSYLLLEVDMDTIYADYLQSLLDEIRQRLSTACVGYTNLRIQDDAVMLSVNDRARDGDARSILSEAIVSVSETGTGAEYADHQLSNHGGGHFEIRLAPQLRQQMLDNVMSRTVEAVRRRIDTLGTNITAVVRNSSDGVVVQSPAAEDIDILAEIFYHPDFSIRLVNETANINEALKGRLPPDSELLYEEILGQRMAVIVKRRPIISGNQLVNASAGFDPLSNTMVVNFRLDEAGTQAFSEVTRDNIGRRIAIVVDDKVISAPVINEQILHGSVQISGNFTSEDANRLAIILQWGAIPSPFRDVREIDGTQVSERVEEIRR